MGKWMIILLRCVYFYKQIWVIMMKDSRFYLIFKNFILELSELKIKTAQKCTYVLFNKMLQWHSLPGPKLRSDTAFIFQKKRDINDKGQILNSLDDTLESLYLCSYSGLQDAPTCHISFTVKTLKFVEGFWCEAVFFSWLILNNRLFW